MNAAASRGQKPARGPDGPPGGPYRVVGGGWVDTNRLSDEREAVELEQPQRRNDDGDGDKGERELTPRWPEDE